jgi:hypothetical protein
MSFKHGTEEGLKRCKPPCAKCVAYSKGEPFEDTNPIPAVRTIPVPDIVSFLHSSNFTELNIKQEREEWLATIRAQGDLYVGRGYLADYALADGIRRYYSTQPETGPITMTYDQTTFETSQGHALDNGDTVNLEDIWEIEEDSPTTSNDS